MQLQFISHSGGHKSISDDDLCSDCKFCDYQPGEQSGCSKDWPGLEDRDGYVQKCDAIDYLPGTIRATSHPLKELP